MTNVPTTPPSLFHRVAERVREDLDSAVAKDPAATSRIQMALVSPGLHALWMHRASHALWRSWLLRVPARILSNVARTLTGVEIHPAAVIGRRVFIDHGMGVVIGETAEVGDDVMLYQGVTLGGRSLSHGKRHPTLKDGVTVGSGARILGPVVVGERSQVGANAVVVKDVPPDSVAIGVPARIKHTPAVTHPPMEDPALWI